MLKKALVALLLFAMLMGAAYFIQGEELFNTSDRWKVWTFMMARWNTPANYPFGTGWGTYHVFSLNLQHYGNIAPGMHWNWLHNNWLTFLFEMGITGFLLSIAVFLSAVYRVFVTKNKRLMVAVVLYAFYMGMNPALNLAYPALFGLWLFLNALRRPLQQQPWTR